MATAHELASAAAQFAARIPWDNLESVSSCKDLTDEFTRVTIRLTDGTRHHYRVYGEKEEDAAAAASFPT